MTTAALDFQPGNLGRARVRVVGLTNSKLDSRQDDGSSWLRLRPLGGADEDGCIRRAEAMALFRLTFMKPERRLG